MTLKTIIFEENNRIKVSWTFQIINYDILLHQRETSLRKRGSFTEVNGFDLKVAWKEIFLKFIKWERIKIEIKKREWLTTKSLKFLSE